MNTADCVFKILDKRHEKIRKKKNSEENDNRTKSTGEQYTGYKPIQLLSYLHAFNVEAPSVKQVSKKEMVNFLLKKGIEVDNLIDPIKYYYSHMVTKKSSRECFSRKLEMRMHELDLIVMY